MTALLTNKRIRLFYTCRDIGYGVESGIATGRFTGETDTWGKHTFQTDNGDTLYLFADEIKRTEPMAPAKTYRLVVIEHLLVYEYVVTAESEQDAREQWESGLGEPDKTECVLCEINEVTEETETAGVNTCH